MVLTQASVIPWCVACANHNKPISAIGAGATHRVLRRHRSRFRSWFLLPEGTHHSNQATTPFMPADRTGNPIVHELNARALTVATARRIPCRCHTGEKIKSSFIYG